ncbi:MAG: response regulator transcription factor [Gammaproteobacteria bacterium]|nr:MAG: response regulator transcription factor [Gammaproteobacteria bacterium]
MNILIVDDSRLARKELVDILKDIPGTKVIAEAVDVNTAVTAINTHKPDLVLLDIHLPDGDGFDVLDRSSITPHVIFTTAYEQHALRAFEVNALDYLLKPITHERLEVAIQRSRSKQNGIDQISTPTQPKTRTDQIFVRDGEHCHFIRLSDLRLINVEGNYIRLYFLDTKTMLARSMNYLEEKLDPQVFFRANRQQIVNMDYVASIEPWVNEGLLIKLTDGTQVEVSRRQARELKQRLEI